MSTWNARVHLKGFCYYPISLESSQYIYYCQCIPSNSPKLMCYTRFVRNMSPVFEQFNIKNKSEVDLSRTSPLVRLHLGGKKTNRHKLVFMSLVAKNSFYVSSKRDDKQSCQQVSTC